MATEADTDAAEDGESGEKDVDVLYPGRGPDREEMAAEWLPAEDDWLAKTVLDLNDPHAVAALRQFDQMFPEVDDLQPVIDEFIDEFLKGRTSIEGQGRKEYQRAIEAMFGGHPDSESNKWGAMMTALGADDED